MKLWLLWAGVEYEAPILLAAFDSPKKALVMRDACSTYQATKPIWEELDYSLPDDKLNPLMDEQSDNRIAWENAHPGGSVAHYADSFYITHIEVQ